VGVELHAANPKAPTTHMLSAPMLQRFHSNMPLNFSMNDSPQRGLPARSGREDSPRTPHCQTPGSTATPVYPEERSVCAAAPSNERSVLLHHHAKIPRDLDSVAQKHIVPHIRHAAGRSAWGAVVPSKAFQSLWS